MIVEYAIATVISLTTNRGLRAWRSGDDTPDTAVSLPYDAAHEAKGPHCAQGETVTKYAMTAPRRRSEIELCYEILRILTKEPGVDDVDIADRLDEPAFYVSKLLRDMAREGMVKSIS